LKTLLNPPKPIPILMYHQVDKTPPKGTPLRGLVVSPGSFFRHMAAMSALGFRGLSMIDLIPYLRGERSGRVFGITFDDGYENNLRNALPVLRRFGYTSTCYVVAQQAGKTNVWDSKLGIPPAPLMSIAQMQAWIDDGQEIGSHTLTHPDLRSTTKQDQRIEIIDSKLHLEAELNQAGGVSNFCYPYGGFDKSAVDCAFEAGYATATTTIRGRCNIGTGRELLVLPRVLVSRTTTCLHLVLKCLTAYEDRRGKLSVTSPEI
jgi:peptidoglycan/xylan/chitin deacetylase (PgdA/CDA1 family)